MKLILLIASLVTFLLVDRTSAFGITKDSYNSIFKPHHSFLSSTYAVKGNESCQFSVRQVPGDGGCLFHALAASLTYLSFTKHLDFDGNMRKLSDRLREIAVETLSKPDEMLNIDAEETILSAQLLELTASHYGKTPEQYIDEMRRPSTWGGGPEITAISHYLCRPIHVYELECGGMPFFGRQCFFLKPALCVGTSAYEGKSPLYLLCADGRFPNIKPGKHKQIGDHFLALYPNWQQQEKTRLISEDSLHDYFEQPLKYSAHDVLSKLSTK